MVPVDTILPTAPRDSSVPQPCPLIHVVPAEQPASVAEIAEILFPAYAVDNGRVSLAGWPWKTGSSCSWCMNTAARGLKST